MLTSVPEGRVGYDIGAAGGRATMAELALMSATRLQRVADGLACVSSYLTSASHTAGVIAEGISVNAGRNMKASKHQ